MRIEHAKSRLVEDLERAVERVREITTRTRRGLGTIAVFSGVMVAAVVMAVLARRSRRRVRITWH
jgi:hypothetical protein